MNELDRARLSEDEANGLLCPLFNDWCKTKRCMMWYWFGERHGDRMGGEVAIPVGHCKLVYGRL